jgi:hypothetical protein
VEFEDKETGETTRSVVSLFLFSKRFGRAAEYQGVLFEDAIAFRHALPDEASLFHCQISLRASATRCQFLYPRCQVAPSL